MASGSQLRSFGRFLYTQNPFYLISCFLVLYGLQTATFNQGDLFTRSVFLAGSVAAYTLLMAITAVGVVRLAKVWEDARSIFLVVIISLVALSAAVDELCISDWNTASVLVMVNVAFAFVTTELVLRACRLKLPSWYRCSYYVLLAIFFLLPLLLGYAVGHRNVSLANWGAPLFSSLIAVGLLLLVPAMRLGDSLVHNNGTPWRWPWYPLSAFVILVVLAAIRSHAIWMSFGFLGAAVRFEPFLLLPIAFAVLILLSESDGRADTRGRTFFAMAMAPAMLLCGVSRDGMTHLPIQAELQHFIGSAGTISLGAVVLFYTYLWVRGLPLAAHAVAASLLASAGFAVLPEQAEIFGVRNWMFAGLGSLIYVWLCVRNWRSDQLWLVCSALITITIAMAGRAYDQQFAAMISAAAFAVLAMMTIGAVFETELAIALRHVAAVAWGLTATGLVVWHLARSPGLVSVAALAAACAITLAYVPIVKRLGWLYVFAVQASCLIGVVGWDGFQTGALSGASLPIHSGLVCFAIGVTITSIKTGLYRRLCRREGPQTRWGRYQRGL